MVFKTRIIPYRQGSKSAKALAEELGGRVLKLTGSKYKRKTGDVLINWGNTRHTFGGDVYNGDIEVLRRNSNKKLFFQTQKENNADIIPEFWTDSQAIPSESFPVVCRTVLAGHSGEGIVIANDVSQLVPAQLYTKYIKKQQEYRIHVGIGATGDAEIISVQRKARRVSVPDNEVNWQVRNLAGGFVFVREGVDPPAAVLDAACRCLESSGLDFGAVDVVFNEHAGRAYVLEINTAPGLEGQTVKDYGDFFRGLA